LIAPPDGQQKIGAKKREEPVGKTKTILKDEMVM